MYTVTPKKVKKYRVCCEHCGSSNVTTCGNGARLSWNETTQKWEVEEAPDDDSEGYCNDCCDEIGLEWSIFIEEAPTWE